MKLNIHYNKIFLLIIFIFFAEGIKAQTYVTAPMTGTPAAGEYVNATSITLSPGFSFTASPGQSLYIHTTLTSCAPVATSLTSTRNYVFTVIPRIPGFNPAATGYSTCDIMQMVEYADGLGRSMQRVQIKGSPDAAKDVVQPIAYDQFNREPVKYLPYTTTSNDGSYKPNALTGDQSGFYNNPPAGVVNIPSPYSQTVYDGSPLNRMIEQGAPGNAWQPGNHTIHAEYLVNNSIAWSSDPVNSRQAINYTATTNADLSRTLANGDYYGAGQLTITVMKDENWTGGRANTTEEYKDIDGRIVLKRTFNNVNGTLQELSTYYVHDDIGNLVFVLPPGADPDNSFASQATLNNLCYQYQYDELNRLVNKHLPGKDWEETIYNTMDQVVFTQDGNQRARNERGFIKYDNAGQIIMTGIEGNHTAPRASIQNVINGQSGPLWELRQPGGYQGYTNTSSPYNIADMHPLVVNYYDNYNNIPDLPLYAIPAGATLAVNGLLTATKTIVLNPEGSYGPALWTINYYDDKGRGIATYQQHYLNANANTGNYDLITNTYNFSNEVIATNRQHFTTAGGSPALTISNTYVYDHMGRKRQTQEQINGGANVLLSQADYNDIGQLSTKHLGNDLQQIAYTYNERGWLKTSSAPLFAMQLNYNDGTTPQYNGNIANQYWGTPGSLNKSYTYTYDNLNRLTAGISNEGYNEQGIAYDVMGNITNLTRQTATYAYNYNGNQLQSVSGLTSGTYGYDNNGNVNYDARIGSNVTYNYLNLPETITGNNRNLAYTYDAAGRKLRKSNGAVNTDYIGGIQYDNGTISFIQTEEGRAINSGNNNYTYEYQITDHLGNSRLNFDQNGVTRQQDDYYPFGMEISRGTVSSPKNEYLYNRKELQEETGLYDYGARFYDPVIARWNVVDPMVEMGRRWSPYAYGKDNPVKMVDPDGMWAMNAAGTGVITTNPAEIEAFVNQMQTQEGDKDKSKKPQTGSYTNQHVQGKYHGKGGEERAAQSAKEKAGEYNDPHVSTDWTPADNDRQAFKDEDDRINTDEEGHKNPGNYNKVKSPGAKYKEQDKKSEEPDAPSPSKNFSPSAPRLNPVIKKVVVPAAAGITIGTIISYLWPVLLL